MLQPKFANKSGGPKTAVDLWQDSKTPLPFHAWMPSAEEQQHLDHFFGERKPYPFPQQRLIQAAA